MKHWKALAAALLVPLAIAACLFVPGKFQSTLTIHADRSFTYAYKGEVVAVDVAGMMGKAVGGFADALSNDAAAPDGEDGQPMPDLEPTPEEKAKKDAEYRDIAAKLAKEAGYRAVEYRGDGVFYVDYEISGVLTHNFTYPYNQDSGMIFPFVGVELRGDDTLRVKAPGFAKQNDSDSGGMGSSEEALARLDGTFTLATDAEIVSQNNEEGAEASGTTRTIRWKVTPTSEDAPMAVLRVKPL